MSSFLKSRSIKFCDRVPIFQIIVFAFVFRNFKELIHILTRPLDIQFNKCTIFASFHHQEARVTVSFCNFCRLAFYCAISFTPWRWRSLLRSMMEITENNRYGSSVNICYKNRINCRKQKLQNSTVSRYPNPKTCHSFVSFGLDSNDKIAISRLK